MHKLLTKLCGKGTSNSAKERKSSQPRSTEPVIPLPPPSPPHELPALDFSTPPIGQLEVQKSEGQPSLAPPTIPRTVETSSPLNSSSLSPPSLPQLETNIGSTTPASFVIPPTPIESSPLASTSTPPSLSDSSSPPPVASTSSLQPVYSSPTSSNHLIPPPSPRPSLSPRSGSPVARRGGGHHRRSSSTGSRSFRETLNAYAVEDANGQRCVNQYIIGQTQGPLGRGTYAVVEKAVDRETGSEYAIKEFSKRRLRHIAAAEQARRERLAARAGGSLRGRGSRRGRGRGRGGATMKPRTTPEVDLDSGPDNLDLVRTEVAIMKKVDHPNIASVHEVIDVTSDDALLMMELCRGGPIMKLKDGERVEPYSEEKTRDIFRQLTLGLAYLHHNEIVHRDIKPDNALFADVDKKVVKFVDFGVSKFARAPAPGVEDTKEGKSKVPEPNSVAGSPAYMAPELIDSSEKVVDEETGYACDCWSLGVTLYALAVGHLPFQSLDPLELFRSIREDDPKIPTTLSPSLQALLSKLLTRDPTTRATIPSLWEDPWITESGNFPLPNYDDNVSSEIDEPSPAELHHALAVYRGSTFLALSAAAKFKGLLTAAATRRASAEKEASLDGATTPPNVENGIGIGMTRSGSATPNFVDSPTGSPLLEPVRNLSPPSSIRGGRRSGSSSRQTPKRFDTVSSLSIGEGNENEDEDDGDKEGANSSVATTPDAPTQEEVAVGEGGISKASGVADFERDGQTWEEPE
ncbi:hypothetical protein JCM3765_000298 [Sporobolomyces pararoseus]